MKERKKVIKGREGGDKIEEGVFHVCVRTVLY